MRLLISGNSEGLGGAQTAFRRLAGFLQRDGDELALLPICDGDSGLSPELGRRVLCRLPNSATTARGQLAKAVGAGKAACLARRFSPDVFVSEGLARSANLVARALRPSCFKIAHDFIFGRTVDDPLLNAAANVFDAIGVQAPSMVTALRNVGFTRRPINWIPCFPEPPADGCRKQRAPWTGNVRLAYFGRLAANKGLDLIIGVLSGAGFSVPVSLDVWGTGSEAQHLSTQCDELGLSQSVKFLGRYPSGPDGGRLMCGYDAIVVPSTGCEGLPLILLEAMAYGVPFLATDVGAIRDCCECNTDAVLVEPTSEAIRVGVREIVKRIAGLEFEPERLREYYRRRFSYSVMAERWQQCLQAPEDFFHGSK
jgi:glycosyltransferase involved in cell wall biosynthesis